LLVLCLWTAVVVASPRYAVAEVLPEFKATQELSISLDAVPGESEGNGGSALPDGTFTPGEVNTKSAEPGGFRAWWQKQGSTLVKGLGAGLIGAGIVALGVLALGLGAPAILAGAGFALLGGAIYGATVEPTSFSWGQAIGVSLFSGASAAVGASGWLPAVGRTAPGLRGVFGVGRGIVSGPGSGMVRAALSTGRRALDVAFTVKDTYEMASGAAQRTDDQRPDPWGSTALLAATTLLPRVKGLGVGSPVRSPNLALQVSKARPEAVVNALSNFKSRRMQFGGNVFQLDKRGMRHILVRHHPEFYDGSIKTTQTFLRKDLSVDDVADIAEEVMRQNRDKLIQLGTTKAYQIEGTVDGVEYVVGINNGRVGQLYPKRK